MLKYDEPLVGESHRVNGSQRDGQSEPHGRTKPTINLSRRYQDGSRFPMSVKRSGAAFCLCVLGIFASGVVDGQEYSWRQSYAKVSQTGDLQWAPEPFRFVKGDSVRYIDYEAGKDANDGMTTETPWKHHPWDTEATDRPAAATGIHTYVFKRGVVYRGALNARDSGREGRPIRLTSDPSWGNGEAVLCGSTRLTGGWRKGADHPDIPQADKVWYRDLDFAPRTLWMVDHDRTTRIPLARMPNWTVSDPEDVKSEWWFWDNPGHPYFHLTMQAEGGGRELVMGKDTKHITGPKELYMGAIIWAEFGWVDGTPYPSHVRGFDASKNAIGFEGLYGSAKSRVITRYHRYYFEDKPHYLDDPKGEFWFDQQENGGRLYLILPGNRDPNDVWLEAGTIPTLLHIADQNHIIVSGLSFRFTNVAWDLTELPWAAGFELKPHVHPACIRVWGGARGITVANCRFEHVNSGVLMKAVTPGRHLDDIVIRDCELRETDHHGITIEEGIQWGHTLPERAGHLFDVKILRNYAYRTGLRSPRVGAANAINVDNAQTLIVAGNIVERPWHAGINVRGAKISHNVRDCPLTRILIFQNKVTDGIRTGDDCGNIETWQGGPAYVFNNISGNPGGFRHAQWAADKDKARPGSARFGMAYYLDGSFKNYVFNNIGWGLSQDPFSRVGATAMFQEIISYQNMFFNNTAFRFVKGSRRQAPHAGRNKFLGNIWDGIGDWVFWHTTPAKTEAEGNERDAGKVADEYALESNAFAGNVFHDITGKYAAFKPSGQWHASLEEARTVLDDTDAIAHQLGVETQRPPMKNPAQRDFRLRENSAATDRGVKAFVPWPLYAMVGEWNFYPAGDDPARLIDEHWYMTPYYYVRDNYYKNPMFPLTGVNFSKENYVNGPLEDWTQGACTFNGVNQYAFCENDRLNQTLTIPIRFRWDKNGQKEDRLVSGKDFKSPQVWDSNFLVEIYFKTKSTDCVLVRKRAEAGYSLDLNEAGKPVFTVNASGAAARLVGPQSLNDGHWHHLIAEADRSARRLTLYVDGRQDAGGPGIGPESLHNESDLYVGGTPDGEYFKGTMEFLRIALGTIADAKTSIDELYAWQFDGPFLRDFTGRAPSGRRDAGALERRP